MIRNPLLASVALFATLLGSPARAVIIDAFGDPAAGQSASQTGVGSTANFASGSMVGGQRDLSAAVSTGSSTSNAMAINVASSGVLTQTQVGSDAVFGLVQWDGPDSNSGIDPVGLGGLDFTAGGHNALRMVVSTTATVSINFSVFKDDPGFLFSTFSQSISAATPTAIYYPYSSFSGSGDFSDVGALMITITGNSSGTTTIDLIETAIVPEPSTMLLAVLGAAGLGMLVHRRNRGRRGSKSGHLSLGRRPEAR